MTTNKQECELTPEDLELDQLVKLTELERRNVYEYAKRLEERAQVALEESIIDKLTND